MPLSEKRIAELEEKCRQFRIDVLKAIYQIQSGHPGGSLSMTEILTVLYLEKMKLDVQHPENQDVDRFVLSKGHGVPMQYRLLAEVGFFPKEEMMTLRHIDSRLQGHPGLHTPGVDIPSGPLGAAFGAAQGLAMAQKLNGLERYAYVVLGDGETNEGAVWEVAASAPKFMLDNLIAILDYNKVQLDGTTDEVMPLRDMPAKWRAFGWNVIECDGHDIAAFSDAVDAAKSNRGTPTIIIANTVKGKGVSFMEGKSAWHGKAIDKESMKKAMEELGGEFDA